MDCQVSINMRPTAPIRAPVYPVYRFCKQTMSAGRRIFPSSPPPPSFISQPVVLSLRVTFDLLQPSRASSPKMTATKDYSALLLQKYACIASYLWVYPLSISCEESCQFTKKYFNCSIQTNDTVVRAVCFNPDKKPHVENSKKGKLLSLSSMSEVQ